MNNHTEKTVLITGAGAGIGNAAALLFADKGWRVIATTRESSKPDNFTNHPNIISRKLDVTSDKDIEATFNWLQKDGIVLDAVINNAGFGLFGPLEGISMSGVRAVYEVNTLGVIAMTKAAITHMRVAGDGGNIVAISSIGGRTNLPYYATYGSTKAAIEGLYEGLQGEVSSFGIRLKLVEPGGIATGFFKKALSLVSVPEAYKEKEKRAEGVIRRASYGESAENVAKVIYKAATNKSGRMRYQVPFMISVVVFGKRFMPDRLYQYIIRSLMG